MYEILKIEYIDENSLTVYYITKNVFETEEDYKILFKYIDDEINKKYNCHLHGLYDVNIYTNDNIYILDFLYIDDYGNKDFNVSILLNSKILYRFYDSDLIDDKKIYLNGAFYTNINKMLRDVRLFEYGDIVYGKETENILEEGILI